MEFLSLIGSYLFLTIKWGTAEFDATFYLFALLLIQYLFVRGCDLYPWYPRWETPEDFSDRQVGIRVHFLKALVPTSYILAVTSFTCLLGVDWLSFVIVLLADLLLFVVSGVNGILIWFHCHDKEPLPVNYFSLNKVKSLGTPPAGGK